MSLHATTATTTAKKKPHLTKAKFHTGARKGTRLPNAALKDAWSHKGQAKQQG